MKLTNLLGVFALALAPAFAAESPSNGKDPALHAYLQAREALASDNLDAARKASASLVDSAGDGAAADLVKAAERLTAAEDLKQARTAFHELSTAMIARVKDAEAKPHAPLYRVHCPMAFGGGADWLQADKQVGNPYYGSKMARCGTVKERIGGANAHDAPAHGSMHGNTSGDSHGGHH